MALAPARSGLLGFVVALTVQAAELCAQDGFADPTFGNYSAGFSTINFDLGGDNYDECTAVASRRDGRIVLAGRAETSAAPFRTDAALALLHPDGTPDGNFNFGGQLHFDILNLGFVDSLAAVGELSDGTIVAAGSAVSSGKSYPVVVLVSTTGSVLDQRIFGYPGNAGFTALAVQPDDKIVLAGYVNRNTNIAFLVVRLMPQLGRDFGFGIFGEVAIDFDLSPPSWNDDTAYAVALQSDGRIVVAGEASYANLDNDMAVARLLANGQPDPQFGEGGTGRAAVFFDRGPTDRTDVALGVAIDPAGRIVLAGCANSDMAPLHRAAFARLTSSGSGDSSFGNMTLGRAIFPSLDSSFDCASGIAAQSDSKVVASGTWYQSGLKRFAAARLTGAGLLDSDWGGGFGVVSYSVYFNGASDAGLAVALDAGRALVAGTADVSGGDADTNFALMRLVSALIFKDGFEGLGAAAWSSVAP